MFNFLYWLQGLKLDETPEERKKREEIAAQWESLCKLVKVQARSAVASLRRYIELEIVLLASGDDVRIYVDIGFLLQEILGDKVEKVLTSDRIVDSPCCLVTGE